LSGGLSNFPKQIPAQPKKLYKIVQGKPWKTIKQVLSTIIIIMLKKKILAKAIGHQKNHAQPKVEGKKSMSQKIATPLHKNNGISLSLFYLFIF